MKSAKQNYDWLLLIHQLPPNPSKLRVRIWRQLLKLGAVTIKSSVYVLPFSEKTHEDFHWLKQEIEKSGGEATMLRASSVEGATDAEIISSFQQARDEEYMRVMTDLNKLAETVREQKKKGHLSAGRLKSFEGKLNKLSAELQQIIATDFFKARSSAAAIASFERCRKLLYVAQTRHEKTAKASPANETGTLDFAPYQERRWVTRKNPHIDRLATAWLIKQFIDKRPKFYFVTEGETVEEGVPFDMFGVEFTHHGEDCTFETMLRKFGLTSDGALRGIAEIVHDIDLKDGKFQRLEAHGLDTTLRGLSALLKDDRKLLQQSYAIFDGLYALLSSETSTMRKKADESRQNNRRTDKRPPRK